MDNLISKLKATINANSDKKNIPFFSKKGFNGIEINDESFTQINSKKSNKTFCFIDGGNAELIIANNLSLQLIRVGAYAIKDYKKVFSEKHDYHLLITFENNKFIAKTFPDKISIEIDVNDESLKVGKSIAKISTIGGFIRRVLELDLANSIADKSDYIIIDGSLEEKFSLENEYLQSLFSKNKIIVGLCKTNNLMTENGKSVSAILLDKKDSWIYNPIAKIDQTIFNAKIFMVKLNSASKHCFRVDFHGANPIEFFETLMPNCNDVIFPGYPYGLVAVDRLARISNQEKEMEKTKLMVKLGADWSKITKMQSTQDAHSILDNV